MAVFIIIIIIISMALYFFFFQKYRKLSDVYVWDAKINQIPTEIICSDFINIKHLMFIYNL